MTGAPDVARGALTALDHVIVAVRDLDAASARMRALLGREPSWRGAHPGAGSANTLFRLENTYLELLAPQGEGTVATLLEERLAARGEGPVGLAFATRDARATHAALAARGLAPGPPMPLRGRERASGAVRQWTTVLLPLERTRGVLLFAIEHRSPPDRLPPAQTSAGVAEPAAIAGLDHAVIRSADPDAVIALYGEPGLGLRLALDKTFPQWGARLLFFRIGGLTVEIAAALGEAAPGGDTPPPKDRDDFWGLSWRVPDVGAAAERLTAQGFDVSEVRAGRRPGTRVCTVRGEPCGVATLVIGPAA